MSNDEMLTVTLETLASELITAANFVSMGEYRKADNILVMVAPRLQSVSADIWRKHHTSGSGTMPK